MNDRNCPFHSMNYNRYGMPLTGSRHIAGGLSKGSIGNHNRVNSCSRGEASRNATGRRGICGCGEQRVQERAVETRLSDMNEGCGCGCGEHQDDCEKLMKQIYAVDFALYEVILYLDAYPEHCEALDYYHKLMERRRALHTAYEASCGPVTAFGNMSQTSWDWVKTPAPWEYVGS